MESIIRYIITSAFCLSAAYCFYALFLKKETGFKLVRFYLIFTVILSLIFPLSKSSLELPYPVVLRKIVQPEYQTLQASGQQAFSAISTPDNVIDWLKIVFLIYLLIVLLLLLNLLRQFLNMAICIYRSPIERRGTAILVLNSRHKATFTFFKWIFLNKELIKEDDQDKIISHENIHVSQYHSFDLILIELVSIAMWFNPLAWKTRDAIGLTHEYLADEGVIDRGINKLEYQALLVNHAAEETLISFSSNFNSSQIKSRIIMMSRNKSSHKTRLKVLIVIPLSCLFMQGIISCSNVKHDIAQDKTITDTIVQKDKTAIDIKVDSTETKISKHEKATDKQISLNTSEKKPGAMSAANKSVEVIGYGNSKEKLTVIDNDPKINSSLSGQSVKVIGYGKLDRPELIVKPIRMTEHNDSSVTHATSKILYVVNEIHRKDIRNLEDIKERIKSVDVIKDKNVIRKYSSDNPDILILITTK